MNGSIVVTPGIIFKRDQVVTTSDLNAMAAPTVLIEDSSITYREMDYEVLGPEQSVISTSSSSITWTLDANRQFHALFVTLNQNVTSFTISNAANGMSGFIMFYNTSTYTIALPSNSYFNSGSAGPHSPTPGTRSIMEWFYSGSNHIFIYRDLT